MWAVLTKTRIGMIVRAATEDSERTRALGINDPLGDTGVRVRDRAGRAGRRAGRAVPCDHRRHGQQLRHHPVRVVVIGGLGSILGAVVGGFLVGLVEAYGQAYAPSFAQVVIFVLMAVVVLVRPSGLFGREEVAT